MRTRPTYAPALTEIATRPSHLSPELRARLQIDDAELARADRYLSTERALKATRWRPGRVMKALAVVEGWVREHRLEAARRRVEAWVDERHKGDGLPASLAWVRVVRGLYPPAPTAEERRAWKRSLERGMGAIEVTQRALGLEVVNGSGEDG